MNKVEVFGEKKQGELADLINQFCAEHNYNPLSISVIHDPGGWYTAFVVVED